MPGLVRDLDVVQSDIQKPAPRLHLWLAIREATRVIEGETRSSGYELIYRFEHAGNQKIVLELYDDGLVCEGFENREDQLPAMLRFKKRLRDGRRELTIVANAEEERNLDHLSDFTERPAWDCIRSHYVTRHTTKPNIFTKPYDYR